MKIHLSLRWVLVASILFASRAQAEPPEGIRSLVEAERQLAADMSGRDPRQALVDRLAGMAILFRPRPSSALQWLQEHPPETGKWHWEPAFAEISGAGDMGYTTGPWSFADATGGSVQQGTYVAIWRWHPKTGWKLLLHAATEQAHPDSSSAAPAPGFAVGPSTRLFPHEVLAAERAGLVRWDSSYAHIVEIAGEGVARDSLGTSDMRRLRSDSMPDPETPSGVPARSAPKAAIEPIGSRMAESGDLGYTYGSLTLVPSQPANAAPLLFSYVHIWRRDAAGHRRLALDLAIPTPPRE